MAYQEKLFCDVNPRDLEILGVEGLSPGVFGHYLKINEKGTLNAVNLDSMKLCTLADDEYSMVKIMGRFGVNWEVE